MKHQPNRSSSTRRSIDCLPEPADNVTQEFIVELDNCWTRPGCASALYDDKEFKFYD